MAKIGLRRKIFSYLASAPLFAIFEGGFSPKMVPKIGTIFGEAKIWAEAQILAQKSNGYRKGIIGHFGKFENFGLIFSPKGEKIGGSLPAIFYTKIAEKFSKSGVIF